jgi:hypothetical protein
MKFTSLALSFALALTACATAPAPYGPSAKPGGAGYSETRIEADRYRVLYRAPNGSGAQASDYALRRAAELTLQSGHDWFAVTQRSVENGQRGGAGPRVGIGVGGVDFGGHGAVSVGTGVGFNLGGGDRGGALAMLEIRFGGGPKPADVNAYDARDVLASLAPPAR